MVYRYMRPAETLAVEYKIVANPVGMVEFELDRGERVTAESGAMVYMRGNLETKTGFRKGGLFKTLKSSVLGGESFFVNDFVAHEDGCGLGLTGNVLGHIRALSVSDGYIIQSGSYIASTGDLTLDTKWQGFAKGLFGTNLFMLKTVGRGKVFVEGWGGILEKELESGERMVLDNYHLVAMTPGATYKITKHGGIKTTVFGGEALVMEITGPGKVYYQTKNLREFARAIAPYLPRSNQQRGFGM